MDHKEAAERVAARVRDIYGCDCHVVAFKERYLVVAVPQEGVILPAIMDGTPIWTLSL